MEHRLEKYLEIEGILNRFFDRFGYCLHQCAAAQDNPNAPHCGCCKDRYYKKFDAEHPAFELLKSRRESLYGKPEDYQTIKKASPCEYHTLTGCLLKTHKSPVCLGFLCRSGIECLRSRFGILDYDYLGFYYALEWILTGDMTGKPLEEFQSSCLSMLQRLEQGMALPSDRAKEIAGVG